MRTGEIYYWNTTKARGHDLRQKYHIFICDSDWQEDNTFLFISTQEYFKDFKITRSDWVEMPKEESFVGCASPAFYTDAELQLYKIERSGTLTVECMRRLALHVQNSETLERRYISRITNALHEACKRRTTRR